MNAYNEALLKLRREHFVGFAQEVLKLDNENLNALRIAIWKELMDLPITDKSRMRSWCIYNIGRAVVAQEFASRQRIPAEPRVQFLTEEQAKEKFKHIKPEDIDEIIYRTLEKKKEVMETFLTKDIKE